VNSSRPPSVALPETTTVTLSGGASTAFYDSGPPKNGDLDAPPVVLLHGWCVNSYVNWGSAYDSLADQHRLIMIDLPGHGHGLRNDDNFSLSTSSDIVERVLDELAIERAIVVGYSLGGAVAQLTAKRIPERVAGLVLASTTEFFCGYLAIRWQFRGLELSAAALRRLPQVARKPVFHSIATIACLRYPGWVREQVLLCDPVSLLEAGASLGSFNSSEWIGELEMPVAVIVTANDRVVDANSQYRLADDAHAVMTIQIDADHDIPVRNDQRFADALVQAVRAVVPSTVNH